MGYFLFTAVIAARNVVLKDEARTRREDIAMLKAAAKEAESEAEQVPESLQHLRAVVTTFGARATAAAALVQLVCCISVTRRLEDNGGHYMGGSLQWRHRCACVLA